MIDKIVSANAEHKSAAKAKRMLWKLSEIKVSVPLIMDLSDEIGQELHAHLQAQAQAQEKQTLQPQHRETPGVVSVAVDGGRIMTRAEAGRGVHDQAWKETKNACLLTMSSSVSLVDTHPHLPACFRDRAYVEKLVREIHASTIGQTPKHQEKLPLSEHSTDQPQAEKRLASKAEDEAVATSEQQRWSPQRLVRTCLSSMASSDEFGPLVAGEAQRRGFYQAARRAFLGDGQAWNWTLQQRHFPDFVAITDFVHPLGYVYDAAQVLAPDDPWPVYLEATEAVWQGRVADFLAQLRGWQTAHPVAEDAALPEREARAIIGRTLTYLENNQPRMDYPRYRCAGLPVSSAMIESLIKEINYRVKGTEKFWNRPAGAESILQIRAAALSDDDRLSQWILNRPGSAHYRKSTDQPPLAAAA